MPLYRVSWTIDVEASSPEQAALKAREAQTRADKTIYNIEPWFDDWPSWAPASMFVDLADYCVWVDEGNPDCELIIRRDDVQAIASAGASGKALQLCAELGDRLSNQIDINKAAYVLMAQGELSMPHGYDLDQMPQGDWRVTEPDGNEWTGYASAIEGVLAALFFSGVRHPEQLVRNNLVWIAVHEIAKAPDEYRAVGGEV